MRILLIEDDEVFADILVQSLRSQRYIVDWTEDGQLGWEYSQSATYDLILTDIDLPKLDGISLCQRLRSQGCAVPILLITAKDASRDRIRGLDAGADDYLIKPLDVGELHARVRALIRRKDNPITPILEVKGLCIDPSSCQVNYQGNPLTLTPKEYSLLELFLRHPEQVFSRANIIDHLWTFDDPPQEESVKSHIKGLRQKLKAVGIVDWIENVYGLGYRFTPKFTSAVGAGLSEAKPALIQGSLETNQEENSSKSQDNYSNVEQQFDREINKLWQKYRGLMVQRMEVLQKAADALRQGDLSYELQESACQSAHKLAGVLGMFEREDGTEIARKIEGILQTNKNLKRSQKQEVLTLIQSLVELLNLTENIDRDFQDLQDDTIAFFTSYSPLPTHHSRLLLNLLVVDDDPVFLSALRPMLEPWGIKMTGLENPLQFWDVLEKVNPDLLILDVEMPQMSGIEICQAVRNNEEWQGLPILFLTAHRDLDTIQKIFTVGADDYIVKPVVASELLTRIVNRWERIRWQQSFSFKDSLTGLNNQPHSSREIENLIQEADKNNSYFCFVLILAEDLRQINIEYRHVMGNQVLQQWGRVFQDIFRNGEILGYWGNGEFAIAIPGLHKSEVLSRLEELLIPLRTQIFTAADTRRFQVNYRVAVAEYPVDGLTVHCLYRAII